MDQRKIKEAVEVLARGGSVIYPTDTIYGIGVDATNEQAVKRLLELKHRDQAKGLSVMVGNFAAIKQLTKLGPGTENLLKHKLPGPYTFILPIMQNSAVASKCIINGKVAVRIPNHPVALELARAYGKPITATSANISGEKPLNSLESLSSLGADYILWAGPLPLAQPSTIVDLTKENAPSRILRDGAGQWP